MTLLQKYMGMIARAPEDGGGAGGAPGAADGGAGSGAGSGAAGVGAGGGNGSWYSSHNFDADTVAWIEERRFPGLAEMAKAGREGSKMARDRNVMARPDPNNLKSWNGWGDLGWNAQRDKYIVNKPQLQEGETMDDANFNAFVNAAHEAHVPAFQAEAIYSAMHKLEREQSKLASEKGAAAKRDLDLALRKEWGVDYKAKLEGAKRAFAFVGGDDFTPQEIEAAVGSPRTAKLFAKLFDLIGEDQMVGSGHGGGLQTETVGGLQAEINRNMADPAWRKAFDDPRNPRHKDVIAQHQGLLERKANLELKARPGRAA